MALFRLCATKSGSAVFHVCHGAEAIPLQFENPVRVIERHCQTRQGHRFESGKGHLRPLSQGAYFAARSPHDRDELLGWWMKDQTPIPSVELSAEDQLL
jgi:hypothetical protein